MTWSTRRGLWLSAALAVGLVAGLTGAIAAVSMLSARDRISLAGGIAVFVVVTVAWAVAAVTLAIRWWRWSRRDRQRSGGRRVLVAYASRRGGTAELAGSIAEHLHTLGVPADVRPAREVAGLAAYEAVVLGGALYMDRWHRDARRFVRRHDRELGERPVWLFASGPLEHLASPHDHAPVATVAAAAARVDARDTATFAGRLDGDTPGFIARKMRAQGRGGDFHDPAQLREWAARIAGELGGIEEGGAAAARARTQAT